MRGGDGARSAGETTASKAALLEDAHSDGDASPASQAALWRTRPAGASLDQRDHAARRNRRRAARRRSSHAALLEDVALDDETPPDTADGGCCCCRTSAA